MGYQVLGFSLHYFPSNRGCTYRCDKIHEGQGQLWIKIFPDKPITKKPLEVRMGKGKGAPEYWVAVVKPGRIMFEIAGVPMDVAQEALRLAAQKSGKDQVCRSKGLF